MLPNFICLGAQKCGTTTIWHLLNAHADVCMAHPRETRFFYDDLRFAEGLQQYEIKHFAHWSGETVIGEKCPEYLYMPSVANRIRNTLGSATKFIVSLRSPAQRAFSHYRHNFNMLRECRVFEEALESEYQKIQSGEQVMPPYGYLARGYYCSQLKHYYSLFPSEQFLLLSFEKDVVSDQKVLCDRLFSFLNINKIYPSGMPFRSGHPLLENLSIYIDQNAKNTSRHYIEIERAYYKFNYMHKLLRFFTNKIPLQRYKSAQRIYSPSESFVQFARAFQKNRPIYNKLSRSEELWINRRYFREDIEMLSLHMPSVIDDWLGA